MALSISYETVHGLLFCSRLLSWEGVFACAFVGSRREVLLIFDQRDWQSCRSQARSGFGVAGAHPRTLEHCHRVCLLIDSHRHRSFTLVSHLVAEHGAETSRCQTGSTESQYGLRHVNGVPVWNGDMLTLYATAALWFRAGSKPGEQDRYGSSVGKLAGTCVGSADFGTLRMAEGSNASFVSCETALWHRCLCQTLTYTPGGWVWAAWEKNEKGEQNDQQRLTMNEMRADGYFLLVLHYCQLRNALVRNWDRQPFEHGVREEHGFQATPEAATPIVSVPLESCAVHDVL